MSAFQQNYARSISVVLSLLTFNLEARCRRVEAPIHQLYPWAATALSTDRSPSLATVSTHALVNQVV